MKNEVKRIPIILPETGNHMYPTKTLRVCPRCNEHFVPRSSRTVYCSKCQKPHELEMARKRAKGYRESGRKAELRAKHYKIVDGKKTYIYTGYNQKGENNGNYKNGSGIDWVKKAFEVLPHKCNRCGATEEELKKATGSKIRCLLLHHKDGNHENNSPDNWEILCKKCHQNHHCKRDSKTGRFVSHKG